MPPVQLILASSSPRRRQLLELLGLKFEVRSANIDESIQGGETPSAYVERVAMLKAVRVATQMPQALILGADTAVVVDGRILGKPQSPADARRMLTLLSGRSHAVLTGIALAGTHQSSRIVESQIDFRVLSRGEIDWYIRTGEPMDKAGAYGAQGIGSFLIQSVHGSYSNVVGLPLAETLLLLNRAGVSFPWSGT
ncbi:MAG TPA: Maf family protein [Myxococcaceae bacterium]|nr:Maf family protein [Myxococcaceae bacterium]